MFSVLSNLDGRREMRLVQSHTRLFVDLDQATFIVAFADGVHGDRLPAVCPALTDVALRGGRAYHVMLV